MASSQSRTNGGERMIHQDYIARIRYSNALPPPPHPPKLLDIPNTGLSSGQYTNPGFASRLAREQPLNIEADAELGMPLDLVGMPGVFDEDESCESSIQATAEAPPIHPNDRLLLRPLASLGKAQTFDSNVSFLRRTEYISSHSLKPRPDARRGADPFLRQQKRPEKRKLSPEPDKGTPAWIKRRIEKSFEVAARNLANKAQVKHPSKRNLKVVEAFPLVPDLDAFPDSGAYVTVKFSTNPVPPSDKYDTRMLAGIFKPIERSAAEDAAYDKALAAHERDPAHNPKPHNMMNYNLFLPRDADTASRFRRRFDVENPNCTDDALYPSGGAFQFPRLRAYETSHEKEMDHPTKFDDEVVLAFREDAERVAGPDGSGKVVFYYPIMQRSTIRNQRTRNIARTIGIVVENEDEMADELRVKVDDPNEAVRRDLQFLKENPVSYMDEVEREESGEGDEGAPGARAGEGMSEPNGGGAATAEGAAGSSNQDQDAEGEEED